MRDVLIIAEAGVNHNGSLEMAKQMALAAKNARADVVKYQTAVPELVARIRKLESEIKRRDAQRWADLCNDCESDGSCPYLVTCPFDEKKCGDVRPADWLKWMEEKK